ATRSREAGVIHWHIGPPEAVAASQVGNAGCAALSGDGRTLVVAPAGAWAGVVDVPTRQLTARLTGHHNLTYVAVSPDGRWVASAAWSGHEIVVWDASTGQPVTRWPYARGHSGHVAFSADSKW